MPKLSDLLPKGGAFPGFVARGTPVISLRSSGAWVPDFTGRVRVHVIGAGGAGQTGSNTVRGGAAGGYARKDINVVAGQSYAVTVGAGGRAAGAAGSATTFVGNGTDMTANGGAGGLTSATNAGGTASGGDINVTGGRGAGQGGGAVGILGAGVDSVLGSGASGGAGIGGANLNVAPGGAGGPAFDQDTPGQALIGSRIGMADVGNLLTAQTATPFEPTGTPELRNGNATPGFGGWGDSQGRAQMGGAFAGGGSGSFGGHGCWGGGGGGAVSTAGNIVGFGGDGGVLIEIIAVTGA